MKRTGIAGMLMLALGLGGLGCRDRGDGDMRDQEKTESEDRRGAGGEGGRPMPIVAAAPAPPPRPEPTPAKHEGSMGKDKADDLKKAGDGYAEAAKPTDAPAAKADPANAQKELNGKAAVETRAWFPETFLFQPLVVTDESGKATVPVRVPDRLTTWRVLALAHTRAGAQGGAVASFLGTLPAYVDPVAPPFLMVGDEIRLPVQAVNTTTTALVSDLHLDAAGATLTGGAGPMTIPAAGSVVAYTTLKAEKPGMVKMRAALGDTDAVIKSFEIQPSGKPEVRTVSGTLAAPRNLDIVAPDGLDPASDRVRLLVFPGALALLRSELSVSLDRNGLAEDAYALLLVGHAPALLKALGADADPEVLRTMEITLTQRAVRWARTMDLDRATLLTAAALAHPDNPLLARLGERAAAWLAANQRPDGSFGGANGWTLQRVLVTSSEALRALDAGADSPLGKQRALAAHLRASGAFERNLARVEDGYTAAAILAAGGVDPGTPGAAKLRKLVLDGLTARPDGSKVLSVPKGVVRADGARPSEAEATALAVLALTGTPDAAALADLGGALLGSYSPDGGWGDGRANLVCMQAVLLLFKDPVPAGVKITLTMDGKPIVDGVLDPTKLRDVMALDADAPGLAGTHKWAITAEPAVAGLGFSLTLRSWTPWPKEVPHGGLELAIANGVTVEAQAGHATEVALRAAAPAGLPFVINESLPAGVQVDTPSLDALVAAGTITKYIAADGHLELDVPALQPGQTFAAKVRVVATLAGTLHSSASTLSLGPDEAHSPPMVWNVR